MKNKDKILVILDVDETLIHATRNELERKADLKISDYYVYERPYLKEFLKEINKYFLLAIWSSASDEYVEEIVKNIIPDTINLEFVWGRSKCVYRQELKIDEYGYFDDSYLNHYNYIKPLKKVKKKGYDLNKILIVDDTPSKSKDNFGNAIYPIEFTGDILDNELQILSKYLISLKDKQNVRRIEKRNWQQFFK